MNRTKSFEKHMDSHLCHDIYYSSNNTQHKIDRLTLENLSKVELAEPSNMPLARYCNELRSGSYISAYPESNIASQRKNLWRRTQQQRLLPSPYQSDSHFLPTAEHDYPTTDTSSSMISLSVNTVGSRQHVSSQSSLTFSSRVCHLSRGENETFSHAHSDADMASFISQERGTTSVTPSWPSTLRKDNTSSTTVPQKKRLGTNTIAMRFKKNLLRFKSTSNSSSIILESTSCNSSYYSPSSSVVWTTTLNDCQSVDSSQSKKDAHTVTRNASWFKEFWQFLKPSLSSFVKNHRRDNATSTTLATGAPVWYSQFRCNPPPPSGITHLS